MTEDSKQDTDPTQDQQPIDVSCGAFIEVVEDQQPTQDQHPCFNHSIDPHSCKCGLNK